MIEKQKIEKKSAIVNGWIIGSRKLGKIMFLLLQQSESRTIQIVIKDQEKIKTFNKTLNNGDFVQIKGFYKDKAEKNNDYKREKEIDLVDLKVINKSLRLPFEIKDEIEIKEDNKYKYRYVDLRRTKSSYPIIIKSKMIELFRKFLNSKKFLEIDTPILSQFSPEGAKTFIVNSGVKEKFYTLPQSPQIFKQILMVSGFSKYYQIAKNFRNEDLRSNRQPEFLQLDIETWMPEEKTIFNLTKSLLNKFLKHFFNTPKENIIFKKISFDNCMKKYGSEKPDLRNPLTIEKKDLINYIYIKRNFDIENYIEMISQICSKDKNFQLLIFEKEGSNFKCLFSFNSKNNQIKKNYEKFFLSEKNKNDGFYIVSSKENIINKNSLILLGEIRSLFNKEFKRNNYFVFLWINKWPLFQKEKGVLSSFRHPFTKPIEKYEKMIFEKSENLEEVRCEAYDLVCNGEEIASGSLRINNHELQKKVFQLIGFNDKDIEKYFGYFLKALAFAAPPHGGIGIGIERLILVFLNLKSIKESIAFPKNIDGSCSLTGAPNSIENQ